jgi:hypothetical protein
MWMKYVIRTLVQMEYMPVLRTTETYSVALWFELNIIATLQASRSL